MLMTRLRVCQAAALLLGVLVAPASAQTPTTPGYSTIDGGGGYTPFDPYNTRVRTQSIIGNGVGYQQGYQGLSVQAPFQIVPDTSVFLIDGRANITYDGRFVGNVGLGSRIYVPEVDRVFGAWGWFDHDDRRPFNYDQWGVSLESLGTFFDMRANAYIPFGSGGNQHVMSEALNGNVDFFRQFIILGQNRRIEEALKAGDFEVGGANPLLGDYGIRNYVGGYYLQGRASGVAYGFKARSEAMVTEDVTVGMAYYHDKIFGTNWQANVTIQLPDGVTERVLSRQPTRERLYAMVERSYRVAVNRNTFSDRILAINPADNEPIIVRHVDNTTGAGGDGTFEHPFNFLPTTTDPMWDIIFVRRGDGTTFNMDQGIALHDNQRLLGEGVEHFFTATQGTFLLPRNPLGGGVPMITNVNPGGNAVTLANNNEVSGFIIDAPDASGIVGTDILDFNLNRLTIQDAGDQGIGLNNAGGTGVISSVTIDNAANEGLSIVNAATAPLILDLTQLTATNNQVGMLLSATDSDMDVVSTNNVFSDNADQGVILTADNSTFSYDALNEIVQTNGADGYVATLLNGSTMNFLLSESDVSQNLGSGLLFGETGGSTLNLSLTANNISENGNLGVGIFGDSGTTTALIGGDDPAAGNVFDGNALAGIFFDLSGTSTAQTDIRNNQITGGSVGLTFFVEGVTFGVPFEITNVSTSALLTHFNLDISTAFGGAGLFFNTISGASNPFQPLAPVPPPVLPQSDITTGLLTVNGTDVTALQGDPNYSLTIPGGGVPDFAQVLDTTYNDFQPTESFLWTVDLDETQGGDESVTGDQLIGSLITADFSNGRTLTGALMAVPGNPAAATFVATSGASTSGEGIVFQMSGSAHLLESNIEDNAIEGNSRNGVRFTMQDNSSADQVNFNNNTVLGTEVGSDQVAVTFPLMPTADQTYNASPAAGNGINFELSDNASMTFVANSNTVTGNQNDGLIGTFDDNSTFAGTFTNNTFDTNVADGFNVTINTTPNVSLDIDTNTFNDNDGSGFQATLTAGAVLPLSIVDSEFQRNGIPPDVVGDVPVSIGHGINIIQESSTLDLLLTGSLINDNAGFGFADTASGASFVTAQIGGLDAAEANTINNNFDVGVGFDLHDTTTADITILNDTIDNTTESQVDPRFNGDAIAILSTGAVTITNLAIGDPDTTLTLSNSDGDGLRISMIGDVTAPAITLQNLDITANGDDGIDMLLNGGGSVTDPLISNNRITDNGNDGIRIARIGHFTVDNFEISDNTITGNGDDGMDISARNNPSTDEYSILRNEITGNSGNGIAMNVGADGKISTVLTSNIIRTNLGDGVQLTSDRVTLFDSARITSGLGAWTLNDISNNGDSEFDAGIEISSIHNIQIGTLAAGNTIENNTGDGIEINAGGTLDIANNTINGNNTSGSADGLAGIDMNAPGVNNLTVRNNDISNNLGDGVEIDATISGALFGNFTLRDNTITFNGRDGVEFADTGTGSATLTITGTSLGTNFITDNGFRGIDIIVAGGSDGNSPDATVNISNTEVLRNGQEGIYAILSSDVAQAAADHRDELASVTPQAGGAIEADPVLNLNVNNNLINDNGQVLGNIGGSGLVIRVGTTGGLIDPNAWSTNNVGNISSDGGVVGNVTNNSFTGNFGADVVFESFTSTVDPDTTVGTWDDQGDNATVPDPTPDVFTISAYTRDPVSRFDLTFTGNSGDEIDATRLGAFYNNDEPIFKSRTDAQSPPGPFGSGTRERNAQRTPFRDPTFPPSSALGANFRFPGMGPSTFRVNANVNAANAFTFSSTSNPFLFDDPTAAGNPAIYDRYRDAFGLTVQGETGPVTGPDGVDLMPYGWTPF